MLRIDRALILVFALSCVAACERSDAASAPHADKTTAPAAAAVRAEPATAPEKATQAAPAAAAAEAEPACGGAANEGGECAGGCDQWNEAAGKVIARDVPKDAVWATLKVTGMTCSGCEQRIIANVGELDGVFAVEADAELGQVRVAMAKAGRDDLEKRASDKINSLGYRVE